MSETKNVLRVENVTMQFGGVVAVDDLSMEVNEGEIVALIGPNGAGKTTAFNVITGVYAPTNGQVLFDGKKVVENHPRGKMRRQYKGKHLGDYKSVLEPTPDKLTRMGMARTFQNIRLWKSMTVFDNVLIAKHLRRSSNMFTAMFRLNAREEARQRAEVLELLRVVGLEDVKDELATRLPYGKQRRLEIARALATDPKVLLCDEATSALDPNTTHAILTLIKDINKKLGITVVVITHQMSVVEEICDRVAILDGGVVVEQGEVREIFANPKTAAAKRLVAPNGGSAARDLSSFAPDDHVVRVTFNGSSTAKPLVASLAAEKGILVSVLSADTRDLSGQCYGSMLLKLPRDTEQAKRAVCYMRSQNGVTVEEVTGE